MGIRAFVLMVLATLAGCQSNSTKFEAIKARFDPKEIYAPPDIISDSQAQAIRSHYFGPVSKPKAVASDQCAPGEYSFEKSNWLSDQFACAFERAPPAKQVIIRDEMIDDLIILSNHEYTSYTIKLYAGKQSFETVFDLTTTALSGTAALATGGITPRILSGVAAFLGGARTSIDKNIFAEQSVQVLINTMNANRLNRQAAIVSHRGQGLEKYGLHTALSDLLEMHSEGSVVFALNSLILKTAADQSTAQGHMDTQKHVPELTAPGRKGENSDVP